MKIVKNKSLKELTTFKIGGNAKFFSAPKTFAEMKEVWLFAKKNNLKTFILGKGSNILFDDRGFFGLVIYNDINFLRISNTNIYAGAGYSFAALGTQSAYNNLSGLEYAAGVPGSIGGAVYMNASAHEQKISDCIQTVTFLDDLGKIVVFKKDQMQFDYRSSIFQKINGVILSCVFKLNKNNKARDRQYEILIKKKAAQPLNERNAGCIFKNPKGFSAGKLIEECNLKNFKIGGAKVSEKHANFIINEKDASSKDVLDLIFNIKKIVKEKKNILLEEEIKIIKP